MNLFKKTLLMTAILFAFIILSSFFGFMMGSNSLIIVGEIQIPNICNYIIGFLFCMLQSIIIASISFDIYDKRIIKIMTPYCIICLFCLIFDNYIPSGYATIILLIYLFVVAFIRKDFKGFIKRYITVNTLIILYQFIALQIKMGQINLGYNQLELYQSIVFSIDMAIYNCFLFAFFGEVYYEKLVIRNISGESDSIFRRLVDMVFQQKEYDTEENRKDSEAIVSINKLNGFQRLKSTFLFLAFNIFQLGLILLACSFGSVFWECVSLIIPYFIYAMFVLKKRYHTKSIFACTALSTLSFYALSKITISWQYSQLFPVIIAMFYTLALFRIGTYVDEHDYMREQLKKSELIKDVSDLESEIKSLKEGV